MKKIIYLALIVLSFTATGGILYTWNKPHKSIDHTRTETVSAEVIAGLFEKAEAFANKKYLNKALTVKGIVKDLSVNDIGQQVILIKGHNEFTDVQCTLKERLTGVEKGDSIKVSGFCNGYTLVVIMDDCKLFN